MTYLLMRQPDSKFQYRPIKYYLLARTPHIWKSRWVGGTQFVFARSARESRFVPPLLKSRRRPS